MTGRAPSVLLGTKLAIPTLSGPLVERVRLLKSLDGASSHKLVAVTGPPGAGKTVLVSQWIRTRTTTPVAWVSLDESDSSVARFWALVDGAYTRAGVATGPAGGRRPVAGSPRGIRWLLDRVQASGGELILVLDNLHAIDERRVAEQLAEYVEQQPAGCQTLVVSRADPPFPLGKLRSSGSLLEVREHDLRFRPDEIGELVSLAGVHLGDEDLGLLEAKTEGWAAGLRLALLSLGEGNDAHAFIQRFAGTTGVVADFLIGEVLDRVDADERDFLLATSIVEHPAVSLCDAVLGRTDSARILRRLEAQNMFIVGFDDEQERFRYHNLFRDLLRADLHRLDPEREQQLHRQAAEWFQLEGDVASAIDHWLAAGRGDLAVDLIAESQPAYRGAAGVAELRHWLSKVPAAAVGESTPRMIEMAQASMAAGLVEEAGDWLRAAEQNLPTSPDGDRLASKILALVAWWHAWRGQPDVALGAAERAMASPTGGENRAYDDLDLLRVRMYTHLEQFDDAQRSAQSLEARQSTEGSEIAVLAARSHCAFGAGSLDMAEQLAEASIERAAAQGFEDDLSLLDARRTLGALNLERNKLDEAEDMLDGVVSTAREHRWEGTAFLAQLDLARLEAARGGLRDSIERLNGLVRSSIEQDLSPTFVRQARRLEAEVWLRLGEDRRAEALAADLPYRPENRVVMARCQLAKRRLDGARLLMADGDGWTKRNSLARSLLLARCAEDPDEAASLASDGLHIAIAEGYFRTIIDQVPEALEVLAGLGLDSGRARFVADLMAARAAAGGPEQGAQELSEREAVVLQCLPTHLSNQEIAAQLYVSPNTLKTHLRNIYRKLGVSSRRQAVARAAALGLLPEPYESWVRGSARSGDA